jgi:hypothetical protein
VPFLLDNKGDVWASNDPFSEEERYFKLKNLKNLTKLAPYIAADKDGQVFIWALDKKTEVSGGAGDEPDVFKPVYTIPKRVEGIRGATQVAYSEYHFVVVEGNRDIIEWNAIPAGIEDDFIGIKAYTPMKKVCSREGVKKIAITDSSIVALYNDGKILGWGLGPTGQTRKDAAGKQVSFDVPNAVDVYLNKFHMVVLTADGHAVYFGGCDLDGKDGNGHEMPHWGEVTGVVGPVSDVVAMSMADNDNEWPDIFLKKDGSVCAAYAPLPPGVKDLGCGYEASIEKRNGCHRCSIPMIGLAQGHYKGFIFLGADHQLWGPYRYPGGGGWSDEFIKWKDIELEE